MTDLPLGIYDQLVTEALDRRLRTLDQDLVSRGPVDPAEAHDILARHLGGLCRRALRRAGGSDATALVRQVALANRIAEAIAVLAPDATDNDDLVAESSDLLQAIVGRTGLPGPVRFPPRPNTAMSTSALPVNGRDQPRIGTEVQRELASADRVDLLCAFVRWHGLRVLEQHIEVLLRRGSRMRVITTTYIGATEQRALDRLVELGAEVKVSYETRMTRLHAKAWLFHRDTGFSTACP